MKFQILTLFPKLIESYWAEGVVAQAAKRKIFKVEFLNPRDFATDAHRSVDDRPFGGGDGMVMLPEILEKTLEARSDKSGPVIYLSPQGPRLTEEKVQELAKLPSVTFICGRYGGLDQRAINQLVDEELSIGDYVLSGGELAALVVIDAVVRKLPGTLGHEESAAQDSFSSTALEHPLFTRPQVWQAQAVPPVLLSGHHGKIREWQKRMGRLVTWKKRPDLLNLSAAEKKELVLFCRSLSEEEKKACGVENLSELENGTES
ncbi:MAG: tRNA (guanosine(37)-N1)-methyltransferase TrmD [Bdellovibrionales bacterium]